MTILTCALLFAVILLIIFVTLVLWRYTCFKQSVRRFAEGQRMFLNNTGGVLENHDAPVQPEVVPISGAFDTNDIHNTVHVNQCPHGHDLGYNFRDYGVCDCKCQGSDVYADCMKYRDYIMKTRTKGNGSMLFVSHDKAIDTTVC